MTVLGQRSASAGPPAAVPGCRPFSKVAAPSHSRSPPEVLISSLPIPSQASTLLCALGGWLPCQPVSGWISPRETRMSDQSGELLGSLGHLSELPPSFSAKPLAASTLPRPRLWGSPAPWAQLLVGSRNTSCYPHPSSS